MTCHQVDVAQNKSKFYVIRVRLVGTGNLNDHGVFTRWGRAGKSSATQLNGPSDRAYLTAATTLFFPKPRKPGKQAPVAVDPDNTPKIFRC